MATIRIADFINNVVANRRWRSGIIVWFFYIFHVLRFIKNCLDKLSRYVFKDGPCQYLCHQQNKSETETPPMINVYDWLTLICPGFQKQKERSFPLQWSWNWMLKAGWENLSSVFDDFFVITNAISFRCYIVHVLISIFGNRRWRWFPTLCSGKIFKLYLKLQKLSKTKPISKTSGALGHIDTLHVDWHRMAKWQVLEF